MKKITLILAIILVPFLSNAQSAFDKYEDMNGVSSVVITSKMFKLLSKIDFNSDDAETQEYLNLVKNIKNIKVLATGNDDIGKKMQADVKKYLNTSSLDELMRVNSDGKNIKFFSKPGRDDDHVSELFMFLNGIDDTEHETVVLTITGDIDLKQVSRLANDLNVPGGEELKNVKKN
ncbi:DUF4252 domain-containing protein [Aquimarina rhabdastrellae]